MTGSNSVLTSEKYHDFKAQLRLIGDRYRRQVKELLKRSSARPQTWKKP
jgi:hypothetical protein